MSRCIFEALCGRVSTSIQETDLRIPDAGNGLYMLLAVCTYSVIALFVVL